jgi:hypothetical protein
MTIYNKNTCKNKVTDTIPYLYKWTQISTGMWYIGSKTKKNWNPDRHLEYICSSKKVKPMIINNPDDWICDILFQGGADECKIIANMETELLVILDAKNDPLSYNQHNGDGLCNRTGIPHSTDSKQKMILSRTGQKRKQDFKDFMRKNNPMFVSTTAKKISETKKGDKNPMKNPKTALKLSNTRKLLGLAKGDKNPSRLPEYQMTCSFCNKTMGKGPYTRWHGDNCKNKNTLR